MTSYLKYLSFVIFILGFFLFRPYHMQSTGLMYTGDDESYFAHASSLAFFQFPSYKNESFIVGENVPMHSIGPGLIASPFVFAFSLIDRIKGGDIVKKRERHNIYGSWALFGFIISSFICFYTACMLIYFGLRYFFKDSVCFMTVLFMVLLQMVPLYVFRRPIFSHIYEFFLQSMMVFLLLKNYKTGFLNKNKWFVLVGVTSGLIALVRYNNVFFSLIFPLIFYFDSISRKKYSKLIYTYGIALLLVLIFKIIPNLYYGESYDVITKVLFKVYNPILYIRRLFHIIFATDWGLIFTAPFLLLATINLFFLKHDLKKKLIICSFPIIINIYIVIMWGTQGAWYGYRYLVFSMIPLMVFPFAYFIDNLIKKYGYKKVLLASLFVSILPVLSMLLFEGNNSNLTLSIIKDKFANVGFAGGEWGNRTYQLEVWKTVLFKPIDFAIVLFKGGLLYCVYVAASIFKLTRFLPEVVALKYKVFRFDILIKTMIIYVLPFVLYFIMKRKLKGVKFE